MRDQRKYFPVNWIDGMKINKSHFIDQDNASADAMHDFSSLNLSPIRYGVLPPSAAGENTFDISISLDAKNTLRVLIHTCQAITPGGVRISLPDASNAANDKNKSLDSTINLSASKNEAVSWIFLFVNPFEKQAAGSPDLAENPPRFPYVVPTYEIKIISESEYRNYTNHPYAIPVGKILINGIDQKRDDEYIPPCVSLQSHPDLISLHGKVNTFLVDLESYCSTIIQNILRKEHPNEISRLLMFLADRMMLCLAQAITSMKWNIIYEPPAMLFATVSALARVMMTTIDLRIGSGKEKLVSHLTSWSTVKLQQGELESMLENLANDTFSNNEIDRSRQKLLTFMKVISPLFDALSKQELPDERTRTETFVKEDEGRPRVYKK